MPLFILLVVFSAVQKLFSDVVPFVLFFFFSFGYQIQKISLRWMSRSLLPVFSFRNFMVLVLTFKPLMHCINFCVRCKTVPQFLLHEAAQSLPHHLLKETVLSLLHILGSFVVSQLTMDKWVISGLAVLFH